MILFFLLAGSLFIYCMLLFCCCPSGKRSIASAKAICSAACGTVACQHHSPALMAATALCIKSKSVKLMPLLSCPAAHPKLPSCCPSCQIVLSHFRQLCTAFPLSLSHSLRRSLPRWLSLSLLQSLIHV